MSRSSSEPIEHHPIPSIRPLPRRSWSIPLPRTKKEEQERFPALARAPGFQGKGMEGYEKACAELQDLGFHKAYCVKSVPHSRLGRMKSDEDLPLKEFSLWHHPAGVLLVCESPDPKWDEGPMGSLKAYFQADLGAGREFLILGATHIRSSGSTSRSMGGTSRKVGSVSASRTEKSLLSHLAQIQKYGRFLPLKEWTDQGFIYIPSEFTLPIQTPESWRGQDISERLSQDPSLARPFLEQMEKLLPAALLKDIEDSVRHEEDPPVVDAPEPAPKEHHLREDWMAVEYSLEKVSEGLFLTKQRFPSPEVKEHVEHWMQVALGKQGEEVSNWRVDEPGPAGMSLATVLLYTISDKSLERLLRLIRERPAEEVKSWCTEPDGAGFVLGQRLIDRALIRTSVETPDGLEKRLVGVYDALVEKVGLENIRLVTPLRSALGVWIENAAGKSDHELSSMAWRREVASKLMLKMVGDGLEWSGPLNWRTYPHVVDSAQDNRPKFMTMGPDPVSHPQWIALTGDNVRGTGLLSALVEADMDRSIPTLEDLDPPSRPKSRF